VTSIRKLSRVTAKLIGFIFGLNAMTGFLKLSALGRSFGSSEPSSARLEAVVSYTRKKKETISSSRDEAANSASMNLGLVTR
jgi:hypothetical protein